MRMSVCAINICVYRIGYQCQPILLLNIDYRNNWLIWYQCNTKFGLIVNSFLLLTMSFGSALIFSKFENHAVS